MDEERKETYLYWEDAFDTWAIAGSAEQLLEALRPYIDELTDGGREEVIRIKRHDMTQAEMDAAPEL